MVVPSGRLTEWLMKAAPTVTLLVGSNWPRTYRKTKQDLPTPCHSIALSVPVSRHYGTLANHHGCLLNLPAKPTSHEVQQLWPVVVTVLSL